MTARSSALGAAVALLLLAGPAGADDPPETASYRIFCQLTTELELNEAEDESNPNDGDYTKFKQLASFNVEWSRVTIGALGEYLYWSDPEFIDLLDLDRQRSGLELRKYYVDYRGTKAQGRLGTFYSSFGRGMTLYVQKNEVLGFDEPIHGATASLNLEHLDLTVLGGRVTDPLQALAADDVEDEVYGGRALIRLPLDLYIGGSAVRAELDGRDEIDVWSFEAGGNSLWGVLDLAGEWSEIDQRIERGRDKKGHGRYLSAAAYVGPVSILAEYKDYYNFAYRFNLAPNAGRADEAYAHDDVKGPRLLVSADIFATGTLLHASYASFDSHKTPTSPGGTRGDGQIEWYAGVEQTVGGVYFQGSYFDRDFTDRKITERHTIGDLHVTVGRRGEIIVGWDDRLEKSSFFSLGTTRTTLAYSLSSLGTASLRYAWEDRTGFEREIFWGVELQVLPTRRLTLTLFGGSDPGGLVCAGGQCRIEPRFKGTKCNATWRF